MYQRQLPEIKSGINEYADPQNSADDIIGNEFAIRHRPNTCDKRGKSTDDGDEASDDDGLATIFEVKSVSLIQMFLFQETEFS